MTKPKPHRRESRIYAELLVAKGNVERLGKGDGRGPAVTALVREANRWLKTRTREEIAWRKGCLLELLVANARRSMRRAAETEKVRGAIAPAGSEAKEETA